jgi:hypothetical protein
MFAGAACSSDLIFAMLKNQPEVLYLRLA